MYVCVRLCENACVGACTCACESVFVCRLSALIHEIERAEWIIVCVHACVWVQGPGNGVEGKGKLFQFDPVRVEGPKPSPLNHSAQTAGGMSNLSSGHALRGQTYAAYASLVF